MQEYYLGSYVESVVQEMEKHVRFLFVLSIFNFFLNLIIAFFYQFDATKVPKRKIGEKVIPYLPVRYVQGLTFSKKNIILQN